MFNKIKALCIVATMMLTLIGCGANSDNRSMETDAGNIVASTATQEIAQEAKAIAETKIITMEQGDIEVPVNPQRVVVQYLMGDVYALGVEPVGISDVYEGAAFENMATQSEGLGWMPEWNPESIMTLDPDLILIINKDNYEKFSKIAPTIVVPYDEMSQDERITFLGDILNKPEEAKAAIEKYNSALEESKEKLAQAEFDQYTVSVFEGGSDATMSVSGDTFGAGATVYKSLGLKAPEMIQVNILDKDVSREAVSFEVLSKYAGDFVIRNSYDDMADLSNDPIWNAIPAIKNNHIINIPFGFNYYTDIYSTTAQVQTITDALLNALEQNPTIS